MNQQEIVNLQQQDYSDISTKLYTLKSAADALRDFTLYAGSPTATSADTTKFTATATSAAAASSYNVVVDNIARAAVSQQTATSDVSSFGTLYAGNGAYASSTTKLTDLTQADGTAAGYAVGDTITLGSTQGGTANTASYTVTANSTVSDLASFMQSNMAGSTVALQPGGKLQITSAPGPRPGEHGRLADAARSARATSTQAATGNTTLATAGGMDISSSGINIHIDTTAGMTMSDVANLINSKNGTVTATTANGMLRLTVDADGRRLGDLDLERHRRRLGDRPLDAGRGRRRDRHDRRQRLHERLEPGHLGDPGRHAQPDDGHLVVGHLALGQPGAGRQRRDHDEGADVRHGLQRRDQDRDGRAHREVGRSTRRPTRTC